MKWLLCLLWWLFICAESKAQPVKIPFSINNNGHILCKVKINDSIDASLVFDSGVGNTTFDSVFWYSHFPHPKKLPTYMRFFPFMYIQKNSEKHTQNIWLDSLRKISYTNFSTLNFRLNKLDTITLFGTDGIFNIPEMDSVHIWELNFDENYIQIHDTLNLDKYAYRITIPLYRKIKEFTSKFFIYIPVVIICGSDTCYSNTSYELDTGSPYDIYYFRKDQREVSFFEKHWQNTPIADGHSGTGCIRRNIAPVVLFDNYRIDSMRFYNCELIHISEDPSDSAKTVGLNFLKRFNLFIDLKNNLLTLVPVKKYEVIESISNEYVAEDFVMFLLPKNQILVKRIFADTSNVLVAAGLKERDIILSIGKYTVTQLITENKNIKEVIDESGKGEVKILRRNKPITLRFNTINPQN